MVSSLVTSGNALSMSPEALRALEGTPGSAPFLPSAARVHLHDGLHGEGQEILLGRTTGIGRDVRNQIQLDCRLASRQHCRIVRSAGHHWLIDLDSRDGTWLNGERVARALLRDGDLIQLGNKVLTFVAPRTAPPPPAWIREAASPSWLAESAPPAWPEASHTPPSWVQASSAQASRPRVRVSVSAPRPVVLRARTRERVCPLCHDAVGGLQCGHCPECLTTYHRTCFSELGGCATLGCPAKGQRAKVGPQWIPTFLIESLLQWAQRVPHMDPRAVQIVVRWVVCWATALAVGTTLLPYTPQAATLVFFVPVLAMAYRWIRSRRSLPIPAKRAAKTQGLD